ncbi:hypothetical protein [Sphingomonas adhaesiva]|uniref:hypothetical protein n=1 Tax=Sphingomonas adhaesiva TaxID=28212 RepID=UPI002FF6F583
MTMIVRLRTAQRDAARADVAAAERALAQASDDATRCATDRDAALNGWRRWLAVPRPDPAIVQLAGGWVAACERAVGAADLDTRIAAGRRDAATSAARMAHARLDVADEARRDVSREATRRRDGREMADAADRFLQGRRA